MADIEEILRTANPLEPADRLRLIARLWASLPPEYWAAPTSDQRSEVMQRLDPATSDSILDVPWRIIDRILAHHIVATPAKVYSAPRRFDLATIFVVTTAYSLLFAAMSALRFPGEVSLIVAGFITLVGIGQAVLYRGLKPRRASIWVGIVLCFLGMVVPRFFDTRMYSGPMILPLFIYSLVAGAILGYLAGTLVGGVFLVTDLVRQRFWPAAETHPDEPPPANTDVPPATDAS